MAVTPKATAEHAPAPRLMWIDMARGFCVIAVVLLHVSLFHVIPLSPDSHGRPLARAWVLFNTAILADLRMPLLLLLSGYLARTKVRQGLGYARTRLAILTNAHLYLVWTLIFFALGVLFFPDLGDSTFEGHSPAGLLTSLLYPQEGPLWFVYVLAISVAVLAATRRVPTWIVLTGFFAVGWVAIFLTDNPAGLPRAIFFAFGALLGERVIALTDSRLTTLAALIVYAFLTYVIEHLDPVVAYPLTVVAGLSAAVAFLAIARIVSQVGFMRVPGAWVGRRTLGIYVLHWPLVALLTWIGLTYPELFEGWLTSEALEIAYPILVTAVVVALGIGLERLLKAIGLGVLFDPPAALKSRVTRPRAQTSPPPGTVAAGSPSEADYGVLLTGRSDVRIGSATVNRSDDEARYRQEDDPAV